MAVSDQKMSRFCVLVAVFAVLVSVGSIITGGHTVSALPLDKETCTAAEAEHARSIEGGVLADIARGPEWGVANLPPARLQEINRFFDVVEQLKFRCRFKEKVAAKPKGPGPNRQPTAAKPQSKPEQPKEKTVRANDAYVPPPGLESSFELPRPAVTP